MHMQVSSRKQIVSKNVSAVLVLDVDICTNEEGVLPSCPTSEISVTRAERKRIVGD